MLKFAENGQGYFDFEGYEIDFFDESCLVFDSYLYYRSLLSLAIGSSDVGYRSSLISRCDVLLDVRENLFRMAGRC
jgi:hypothetical protein